MEHTENSVRHLPAAEIVRLSAEQKPRLVKYYEWLSQNLAQLDAPLHAFLAINQDFPVNPQPLAFQGTQADRNAPFPWLAGVPIAVKDNIMVQGLQLTCGSHMLEGFMPDYSATVVERLVQAGALIVGKTNMDEFSMGSSTLNSAFGPTCNPQDLSRAAGGSSGGSAAAVAADLVPLALGTDTGGSVRQPAAWCGVYGLRPTYGLVSRWGLVALASSLDQIGALARDPLDCALFLLAVIGADPHDLTALAPEALQVPSVTLAGLTPQIIMQQLEERLASIRPRGGFPNATRVSSIPIDNLGKLKLEGVRLGVPDDYQHGVGQEVAAAFQRELASAAQAGAQVVSIQLPSLRYALPAYHVITAVEASSNLARFDGLRYGLQLPAQSLHGQTVRSRSFGFGLEVKRRLLLGAYLAETEHSLAYQAIARQQRQAVLEDYSRAFAEVDFVVTPSAPEVAMPLNSISQTALEEPFCDSLVVGASLAGLPALSCPIASQFRPPSSLPIGIHLVGPRLEDARVLALARSLSEL